MALKTVKKEYYKNNEKKKQKKNEIEHLGVLKGIDW